MDLKYFQVLKMESHVVNGALRINKVSDF
ncbi:unnamed protein product [Linum tenue]|uniref:Uncharacterized protein n=1 Tax=Linum tenue TaxID=586396 RepID=A0AAV0P252_9ROSI|nr:unnamed protein product [Linum tenue]